MASLMAQIGGHVSAAQTLALLKSSRDPLFGHSRYIDQALYAKTNPTGVCGYVMVTQVQGRGASLSATPDADVRPINLWNADELEDFIASLRALAASMARDRICGPTVEKVIA